MLALQIALVHFLYNVFGVATFLNTLWLKDLPVWSAVWLGNKIELNRGWASGSIGSVFFLMLGLVFASGALLGEPETDIVSAREGDGTVTEAHEEVEEVELLIE